MLNYVIQEPILGGKAGKLTDDSFTFLYDSYLRIPLLDADGKEGVFHGYLLFCKNEPIAEIVVKAEGKEILPVFLSYARFDEESGSFEPFSFRYAEAVAGKSGLTGVKWVDESYLPF